MTHGGTRRPHTSDGRAPTHDDASSRVFAVADATPRYTAHATTKERQSAADFTVLRSTASAGAGQYMFTCVSGCKCVSALYDGRMLVLRFRR